MTTDLYDILQVNSKATPEEIKKAYRKLSLQHHPDRNNNSLTATEKFQKLASAYNVLGDEQKRRQYDMQKSFMGMSMGGMGMPMGGMGMPMDGFFTTTNIDIDPSDLLNFLSQNIFQQGGGTPQHKSKPFMNMDSLKANFVKPPPIIKTEEITLSKAYTGCTIPVEITRWVLEQDVKREETETIYVDIRKGADNNEIIIAREKGNILRDNVKGDVKVFLKILNDTDFVRTGIDLFMHKRITLKEALCGFSFDMKHVDGRVFKINNGTGNIVSNNYNKILTGMGMKRDEHVGNLTINFTIVFPEKLTSAQVEELNRIL